MFPLPTVYTQAPYPSLPVAIDYPAALSLRQLAALHDELPKYLLAPGISALLHYIPDLERKTLFATLWNTGTQINEALALGRTDYLLQPPYPFVQLATLKQRWPDSGWNCTSSAGTAVRSALSQPAADDGGHAENSARAQK